MGRTSLIYLKWQFKHSSMSMTQLYASNPQQDLTLFDEIFQQMTEFKIDLIESWLDDQPLAGALAKRLWSCGRFQSRIELLCLPRPPHMPTFVRLDTAGASPQSGLRRCWSIRSHTVSRVQNSVIDEVFASTWQDIYIQQRELIKLRMQARC